MIIVSSSAEALKEYRKAHKLTQKALAAKLGVSDGRIAQIETGDKISSKMLMKLEEMGIKKVRGEWRVNVIELETVELPVAPTPAPQREEPKKPGNPGRPRISRNKTKADQSTRFDLLMKVKALVVEMRKVSPIQDVAAFLKVSNTVAYRLQAGNSDTPSHKLQMMLDTPWDGKPLPSVNLKQAKPTEPRRRRFEKGEKVIRMPAAEIKELEGQNRARRNSGLKELTVKVHSCLNCQTAFESVRNRMCPRCRGLVAPTIQGLAF